MKVLLTSASFAHAYGGPAYSVSALAEHLALRGLDIAIWAPDGSATNRVKDCKSHPGVIELGGSLNYALQTFGRPDLFHDSGIWWRHNRQITAAATRLCRPLVVSTRGMLEPAALRHRGWKKSIAWLLYQERNLNAAAALHVTSPLEAEHVRALGLKSEIICIPNGLPVSQSIPQREPHRQKRAVFLGRLHPIKGLPILLEAWAAIRPTDWCLEIAGPDEGGHLRELQDLVDVLAIGNSVQFQGPVRELEKQALLAGASLLILPSYSESFGVAAGEALAAGVPVIATKGTPWAALEQERCGWHVATTVNGLESGLRSAFSTPTEELLEMGQRGHAYVARAFSWKYVSGEMERVYSRLMTKSFRKREYGLFTM